MSVSRDVIKEMKIQRELEDYEYFIKTKLKTIDDYFMRLGFLHREKALVNDDLKVKILEQLIFENY